MSLISVSVASQPHCPGATAGFRSGPRAVHAKLLCSFSPRSLLILFVEIDYWERLLFETPHYVMNVAERAEDLRILRENLLLVARDYNR